MDGCAGGWVLVTAPVYALGKTVVQVVPDMGPVVEMIKTGGLSAVGIDIPIGLSDSYPRVCDVEARKMLGPRARSVFPAPVRAVLRATSYEEACALSVGACGKRLSKQLFNILAKIAEVDSVMTSRLQDKVFEVHPEVSFWAMAGGPMAHYKRTPQGRDERIELLRQEFPDVDQQVAARPRGCAVDDVLDAYATAWTARRWMAGTSMRLGGDLDARGLRMEVIA
jgi:predicted RNase H-like nuclease